MRLFRVPRDDGVPGRRLESEWPTPGRVPRAAALVRDERRGGPAHVLHARGPVAPGDPRQSGGPGGRQSGVPVGRQPGAVHAVVPARALSSPRPSSSAASPPPRLLPAGGAHDASHLRARFAR